MQACKEQDARYGHRDIKEKSQYIIIDTERLIIVAFQYHPATLAKQADWFPLMYSLGNKIGGLSDSDKSKEQYKGNSGYKHNGFL